MVPMTTEPKKNESENPTNTKKGEPENPIETMQHVLAAYAIQLAEDDTWRSLVQQVPRGVRRELARRFGYMVLQVHEDKPLEDET